MYCKNCGKKLPEGATFCGYCGAKLNNAKMHDQKDSNVSVDEKKTVEKTDRVAPSDSSKTVNTKKDKKTEKQIDTKKSVRKAKQKTMTVGQKIGRFFRKLLFTVIILLIIAVGVAFLLAYFNVCEIPYVSDILREYGIMREQDDGLASSIEELEEINIGESTRARCEVLDTIEVSDSTQTISETEVIALYEERGFSEANISSMYSMDGEYLDDQVTSSESETQHPLYSCLYVSQDNYYWQVYYCNGEFSAYPLSYVLSGLATCEVLISENEYVMSYDSDTNCFYKIIPNEGEGLIIETERIDAETLDEFAAGELSVS